MLGLFSDRIQSHDLWDTAVQCIPRVLFEDTIRSNGNVDLPWYRSNDDIIGEPDRCAMIDLTQDEFSTFEEESWISFTRLKPSSASATYKVPLLEKRPPSGLPIPRSLTTTTVALITSLSCGFSSLEARFWHLPSMYRVRRQDRISHSRVPPMRVGSHG